MNCDNLEMPNFAKGEEETDVSSVSSFETANEPRHGRTKEQKKEYQLDHYYKTKEYRLLYRQSLRGQHKVPNNRCYLHTAFLPRYIREPKKKPKANLDWMNYGGKTRTLTITQPTDELIALIRSHIQLPWEETFEGVLETEEEEGPRRKATGGNGPTASRREGPEGTKKIKRQADAANQGSAPEERGVV